MPKKKNLESQAEQSKRFRRVVRGLEAAGELSAIEADSAFEKLMKNVKLRKN